MPATISATLLEAFAEFEALYTPAAFRATTPTTDQIQSEESDLHGTSLLTMAKELGRRSTPP
jgi:hypothetical protein